MLSGLLPLEGQFWEVFFWLGSIPGTREVEAADRLIGLGAGSRIFWLVLALEPPS